MKKKTADILCTIAALFGLLSVLGGIMFCIPAILLGVIGFVQIRQRRHKGKGYGLCGFAIAMGLTSILFYIVYS